MESLRANDPGDRAGGRFARSFPVEMPRSIQHYRSFASPMSWGPEGYIYVTASQIHRMPRFHGGVSKQEGPYGLFRFKAE